MPHAEPWLSLPETHFELQKLCSVLERGIFPRLIDIPTIALRVCLDFFPLPLHCSYLNAFFLLILSAWGNNTFLFHHRWNSRCSILSSLCLYIPRPGVQPPGLRLALFASIHSPKSPLPLRSELSSSELHAAIHSNPNQHYTTPFPVFSSTPASLQTLGHNISITHLFREQGLVSLGSSFQRRRQDFGSGGGTF